MKGSFIIVFLLVEFIALLNGFTLRAQVGRRQMPVVKNNFTSFTRTYTNRGKLWMARNKAYLHHPNANFGDEYSPNKNAVELFEKRTIDSKFYINKDTPSICYAQRSSSPMHIKRNGQWITIDSRLSPKGPLLYEASYQEDPLGFDIKRKSSYIITPDGRTYFNDWKLYGANGNREILLATADWTHHTVGDDGIAIKNIFPGIDAEMKVSRGSIKTNFIIHANKFSTYKTLLFRDSFLNGHPGNFTFSNGLPGNGLTSSVDFRVSAATVFHIKEGVMYQKENPSSTHQFVPYYLDHNKLTLAINSDFLNTQLRIGDVVVDPLVQDMGTLTKDMITGSHSNQDCSMDTACQYDFMVPAPPGAMLTDAMFSFEFTANAPCVRQDGAFSFAINNGCLSQKYQGTDSNTGPQNFPNQSILLNNGASVTGCFPSPVCGPQNIPFSFYFYRNCNGPVGCDGSCIGASKDLTITIVGRTFDSATLSVSQPSSCAGAPVTLTARGYYGIQPYFFIWQGLPQFNGDSVIQVNPNTNTTYSVQISGACPGPGGGNPITKSVNVNVTKLPTPTFTSNSPVCTGGQLILSAPAKPGISYFIENSGTGLGAGQYASMAVFNNVTTAYAGTWIAVATDANGCTSDTASTTVVINPTFSPTVTISSSATNICTGTQVTFTATAINAGNAPTYQWLLNGKKVGSNNPVYSGNNFVNNDAVSCIVSASGPCAGPFDVSNVIVLNVSPLVTPTFNAIGPLCQNSTPPVLPPTSKEGITGTWSPASINTSALGTATYRFTPSAGSCANPASLNVTIVANISPTFPTIANSYCQNTIAPALPATSKEGITGTWSPASINTSALGTATYTFTPSAGSCATPVSVNVTIVSSLSPTFDAIGPLCQNSTPPPLPPKSKEGIAGTWSPASINTSALGTATYTFTPSSAGNCAIPVSLNITIVVNITPTFPTIANSYCQNSTAPVLPATSQEGIAGTWSPASINTSVLGTAIYRFTPSAGSCATPVSVSITIVSSFSPIFDAIGPLCQNSTPPVLPPTSKEGITGTWSPASINTSALGTATYRFTPSAGSCATPASLNVTIVARISPTFPTITNSYCQNTIAPALPATSKEGITGTWSPASINTSALGTATYTFTPSAGSCATPVSVSITIVSSLSPTFDAIGPLCQNSTAPALPPTSREGITGTWSPASINTSALGTATYTFTPPSAGNCAIPVSLNITIVGNISPTFPTIADTYCQNTTAPVLPTTSKEGITGTWSPASINTSVLGTATYTFTPSAGSCATPVSVNVTIVSSFPPIFDAIGPLCQNSTPPVLPPTSKEGITGTWSPASINTSATGTVTYTFTPSSAGNCVTPASLNVTIVAPISPTFPTIADSYCQNSTVPALPATSKEGITGTWSPASINTSALGTATYEFTPSAGNCASPVSLNVTIVNRLLPTFDAIGPLCQNSTAPALPPTSREGITGTWSPASINTSALGSATYTFTPSAGNCATPSSIIITIVNTISPTFPTIADSYCLNDIAPALPPTSKEGVNGTWNPSAINTSNVGRTVYTFTPAGSQCGVSAQIAIVVNPPPVLTMGPDISIAEGASTTLNVSVTGNIVSYQWKPSTGLNNATIKDPVASPSSTTTYTLVVIDDNNCEASGSNTITVSGRSKILVPNAFSPNGDGINDTWIITNLSVYPGATVDVFNRYGQPVYHSENANKAWDGTYNGKPLPVGTYYYIIDLKNNEKKTAGSVTIFK